LDVKGAPEDLEHRQVGRALSIGRALPFEPRDRLAVERLPELEQQPRLADPRFTHHAHDLTSTRLRALPALGEPPQFMLASGQRAESTLDAHLEATPPPAPPRDVEDTHRLRAALDGHRAQRVRSDVAFHGAVTALG